MNSYEISRKWFDWCFDNASKIRPVHTALFFFIIEHNNRLGWKKEFGLPRNMAMDAIGVKNNRTFTSAFSDLEEWGFIEVLERSKNQHSANIISISGCVENTPATTKALDKAMQKHVHKHSQKQSIGIAPINKHINKETLNIDDETKKAINDIEVIDALTLDSFYPLEILKRHYLGNQEVLSAVLKIKENGFKDEKHLREKMDEFIEHLTGQYETIKTPKDFASHFRNWNKNPGRAKTEKKESPFSVNKLEKYS